MTFTAKISLATIDVVQPVRVVERVAFAPPEMVGGAAATMVLATVGRDAPLAIFQTSRVAEGEVPFRTMLQAVMVPA